MMHPQTSVSFSQKTKLFTSMIGTASYSHKGRASVTVSVASDWMLKHAALAKLTAAKGSKASAHLCTVVRYGFQFVLSMGKQTLCPIITSTRLSVLSTEFGFVEGRVEVLRKGRRHVRGVVIVRARPRPPQSCLRIVVTASGARSKCVVVWRAVTRIGVGVWSWRCATVTVVVWRTFADANTWARSSGATTANGVTSSCSIADQWKVVTKVDWTRSECISFPHNQQIMLWSLFVESSFKITLNVICRKRKRFSLILNVICQQSICFTVAFAVNVAVMHPNTTPKFLLDTECVVSLAQRFNVGHFKKRFSDLWRKISSKVSYEKWNESIFTLNWLQSP